jgi:hypothetical protein
MRSDLTAQVAASASIAQPAVYASATTINPNAFTHKNFIDDYIFGRMAAAGIQSAPLSTDTEFLRRVTLDLTGRIPAASDIDTFASAPTPLQPQTSSFASSLVSAFSANPPANNVESKRDLQIDALIGSPEFIDKWTMFLGDLLKNNAVSSQVNRFPTGRDAFYYYIKNAIATNTPYDQIAREVIAANGDTYAQGQTNWPVGNTITMGPAQDTYDGSAVNLASMFLGINTVDCLLCHDGPRHLDNVSLWGYGETRYNMWGLSAYFARLRMPTTVVSTNPTVVKYIVSDAATGEYQLNTTTGNRQARLPAKGAPTFVSPSNPFDPTQANGGVMQGEGRRDAIARQITGNIQFSRAIVNYVWEKLMVQAFVSPSNTFDLARLDSANPPPSPWTLQPTNPDLLNALAVWFQQNHYDLRALIGLITKSNAYQLSAVYPGNWDPSYVPFYARKYVRRLDAEEVHDAITKATGIIPTYTLSGGVLPPVQWAMQLPDTKEPASNGPVAQFLNSFGRGDRDTSPRRSDGSILQSLNLMNNNVIMSRIHQTSQGSAVQTLLAKTSDPKTIIDQLFLNTLSRHPSSGELAYVTSLFQQEGTRVAAENLQWVLINKMEFLFNY